MKSRFFYGVFTGFILACLFFFGVMYAKAQAASSYQPRAYYGGGNLTAAAVEYWNGKSMAYSYQHVASNHGGADMYRAGVQRAYYYDTSV